MEKKQLSNVSGRSLIILFFGIVLISGLFGVYSFKQLFMDGSIWAYDIFENRTWHYEPLIQRFSTRVLQTPAVIASSVSRNPYYTIFAFCLSYYIYPFVAFGFLWMKYRNHQRKDVLVLPLLTFFLAIIPCWAFSVAVVTEAIVLFWFYYCYIIFEEEVSLVSTFLFSLMLFYTYELGVFFYPLAAMILWREKKLKTSHILLFVALLALQLIHLVTKVMPGNVHQHFRNSLKHSLDFPAILIVPLLLVTLGLLAWGGRFRKFLFAASVILLSLITIRIFQFTPSELSLFSYVNRTWVIPAAILVFYFGYETLKKSNFQLSNEVLWLFAIFCIPALLLELSLTFSHYKFSSQLQQSISRHNGCEIIDENHWSKLKENYYVADWTLPYLTILHNRSTKVQSILIPPMLNQSGELIPNHCGLNDQQEINFRDAWNKFTIRTKSSFDFSGVLQ